MIETRRLPDGRHMLEARVALHDEQRGLLTGPITEKAAFVTRHFWDLYDDFTAPIGTGWFAGFEFSKTCAASAGWEYSSGREEEFLGDGSRRVRPSNSTEHLAWETPLLSEYKLALYANEIAISSVIWVARIFVPPPDATDMPNIQKRSSHPFDGRSSFQITSASSHLSPQPRAHFLPTRL
jgi:hypothetical protein